MKTLYTFIFLAVMMSLAHSSYAQFTGGCSDALGSDIERPCTPTECAPNAGTFMQASVVPNYGGVIFPCPTSTVSYANSVRFTGAASNLTGEYRVTLTLDPAEYIENLSLPAVPAYFTGTSTTVTIDIPSNSPVAAATFPGYTKTVSGSRVITITWLSRKTGTIPTTQFTFPVSFNISASAPTNIGVGQSMFAGVTGRTSLPPNQVCQTRTIAVAAPLRCSFDPNEKVAYPAGCGDRNLISAQDTITYFLHFQNKGSGPAARVRLIDTLDSKLDINTLQVFDGSHPYTYQMLPGNILVFDFDPIYLPPSSEDDPGSNGHVSFSIAPKATVMPRDVISNKTDIYFDNNPPITTNTVFHTIKQQPVFSQVSIVNKDQIYCSGDTSTLIADGADSYLWSTGDTTASITITQEGIYTVIGKYDYSCLTDSDTAVVMFANNAPFGIANKNRNFCPGQSYQFTASAALSYSWSTGATSQSIIVDTPGKFIVAGQLVCGGTAYDTATLTYDPLIYCTSTIYGYEAFYYPGTKKNGTNLSSQSKRSMNALGPNDNLNAMPPSDWLSDASVSLGYDKPSTTSKEGVLIIRLAGTATNSITVWSIRNSTSLATANVYVGSSLTGVWTHVGVASNQNQYSGLYSGSYFKLPANTTATYIKIETISTSQFTEGFVVEAVSGQPPLVGPSCNADAPAAFSGSVYSVYPNPFENAVSIDIPEGQTTDLRVLDAFGQPVYERKGVSGTHQISLSPSLRKGLYYLQIMSGNKIETKTISKQ